MRKHLKKIRNSAKRSRRLTLAGIVIAIAVFAIGAATVVSRQGTKVLAAQDQHAQSTVANVNPNLAANKDGRKYITVKVAGQDIQLDSQTGEMKPLTPQEEEKLAAGLKPMLNQSTEGLVQVQHADGSVSMDLQGRFQNVAVARMNQDGSVSESCVDNPRAAGAFFGIDPRRLGDNGVSERPARVTPVRNQDQ
jgi:hypothetical protein